MKQGKTAALHHDNPLRTLIRENYFADEAELNTSLAERLQLTNQDRLKASEAGAESNLLDLKQTSPSSLQD